MHFLALKAEYIFMFLACAFNYVTFFGQRNLNGIGNVPVLNLILQTLNALVFHLILLRIGWSPERPTDQRVGTFSPTYQPPVRGERTGD